MAVLRKSTPATISFLEEFPERGLLGEDNQLPFDRFALGLPQLFGTVTPSWNTLLTGT